MFSNQQTSHAATATTTNNMSSQPNQFQNLEISDGRPPTARAQQHNGSIINNKSTDLQTENKRLKIIVWMFSLVAVLAIGGLAAAVVVAIRQSNKATTIQEQQQQQQQQTQAPQKPATVIYYFNDDEKEDNDTGDSGIVDPVEVDSEDDGFGSTTASGVVIITPEDLMTDPPVVPGVLPTDDPLGI